MSRVGLLAAGVAIIAAAASVVGWQAEPTAPATASAGPDGATLFSAKGCATCHTGPDTVAAFGSYPSLRDAATWAGGRRPGMSASAYLAESIRTPSAFISPAFFADEPTPMPDLGLGEADIEALVGYLLLLLLQG